MPRPVRSHPESPVRRIQKGPITGAVDAGSQATAAWRDRQRVHGPATRCCRTQAENQSLLDHGSQRSAFPGGLRTSLGEQLVTNVNCCLHHNHRTTHSTEVYAVSLQGGYSGTCPLIPTQTLLRGRAFAAAFGSDQAAGPAGGLPRGSSLRRGGVTDQLAQCHDRSATASSSYARRASRPRAHIAPEADAEPH